MRIILDEQLDPTLADVLNVLQSRHGCTFVSLRELAPPKTQDIEIPELCREHGAVALVTADVKDFGAKKVYFQALLEAGVSVITLRPQKRTHSSTGQQQRHISQKSATTHRRGSVIEVQLRVRLLTPLSTLPQCLTFGAV